MKALRLEGVVVAVAEPGRSPTRILDIDELEVPPGQALGVAGPSGSGKTSLLHVVAGLLAPSAGRVLWGDDAVSTHSETARDRWRRQTVGLVFQDFALLPELDALDNILLPASFDHWRTPPALAKRGADLMRRVGLATPQRRASRLSRGEQQRVGVARALLREPALILADEPTASLDADNGASVAELLIEMARDHGATLIVASHDARLLARLDRVVHLDSGRLRAAELITA